MNKISEITINYKPKKSSSEKPTITNSKDASDHFKAFWSEKIEYVEDVCLMVLNNANRVLGFARISSGGTCQSFVDVKMVFQAALKSNAHAIILCHNHPSGNLKPSKQDILITNKIKKAGELLDIRLFDHLIISKESYFSFADNQLI